MSEYYAVVRSTDHLAHYGVKGMKWGVRRALAKGNQRALDRNFRRAARKLKKLTDIGLNSKKYAIKAAAYGAAAAGTGTIAAVGASGYGSLIRKKAAGLIKNAKYTEVLSRPNQTLVVKDGSPIKLTSESAIKMNREATKLNSKADRIESWANSKKKVATGSFDEKYDKATGTTTISYKKGKDKEVGMSNNTKLRLAAGAATLGLGAMSAVNAYRASHPQKYRKKAVEYKNAMDEVFSGTKYAGKYVAEPRRKKRRKSTGR